WGVRATQPRKAVRMLTRIIFLAAALLGQVTWAQNTQPLPIPTATPDPNQLIKLPYLPTALPNPAVAVVTYPGASGVAISQCLQGVFDLVQFNPIRLCR